MPRETQPPQQLDSDLLQDKAREAILAGKIPKRRPERMWGGKGDGAVCVICGVPVGHEEFGFEIEWEGGPDGIRNHKVHLTCFTALEAELGVSAK